MPPSWLSSTQVEPSFSSSILTFTSVKSSLKDPFPSSSHPIFPHLLTYHSYHPLYHFHHPPKNYPRDYLPQLTSSHSYSTTIIHQIFVLFYYLLWMQVAFDFDFSEFPHSVLLPIFILFTRTLSLITLNPNSPNFASVENEA